MDIQETTFGPQSYLLLRKTISIDKISDKQMYDEAGKKLWGYIHGHGLEYSGNWSVIYFSWQPEEKQTDMAVAFPVKQVGDIHDDEFTSITIPATPAAMGILKGPYDGLGKAHEAMMTYAKAHDYSTESGTPMALEEYVVDGWKEKNPENFVTNLFYFHK